MEKSYTIRVILFTMALGLMPVVPAIAQIDMGADIMSRYVWRGAEFGNSPSLQPELAYTSGGLEIGVWGAYATTGNPDGTEVDLFASYTFDTDNGAFSVMVTDYTFPVHHNTATGNETWLSSDAHFIEAGLGYEGPASFPVSVMAGMFVHNDDDNSVYIELGYDLAPVGLFIGMTPMESEAYGTTGPGIINMGFDVGHDLRITETFQIGLTTSIILNPYAENMFFLFGFSI